VGINRASQPQLQSAQGQDFPPALLVLLSASCTVEESPGRGKQFDTGLGRSSAALAGASWGCFGADTKQLVGIINLSQQILPPVFLQKIMQQPVQSCGDRKGIESQRDGLCVSLRFPSEVADSTIVGVRRHIEC